MHGSHKGLSWGWISVIWLAYILSQGDHRKLPGQGWVCQAQETIVRITGLSELAGLDFTDDRLTKLLTRLSQPVLWQVIEQELGFCKQIYKFTLLTPYKCLSTSILH
ncbi:MAG: hypothetical protein ACK47M_14365 [Caldilinea sp.]